MYSDAKFIALALLQCNKIPVKATSDFVFYSDGGLLSSSECVVHLADLVARTLVLHHNT